MRLYKDEELETGKWYVPVHGTRLYNDVRFKVIENDKSRRLIKLQYSLGVYACGYSSTIVSSLDYVRNFKEDMIKWLKQ